MMGWMTLAIFRLEISAIRMAMATEITRPREMNTTL